MFANLSKAERIEKAVKACAQDDQLTVRKFQQLLTPVEERTLVKWVIQYYKWGLPLNLKQLRQFTLEILIRKSSQLTDSIPFIGKNWHQRLLSRNPEIRRVLACGLD
jgi:Tc5 transposase DNA-binding domain